MSWWPWGEIGANDPDYIRKMQRRDRWNLVLLVVVGFVLVSALILLVLESSRDFWERF